jgi:uncharacterized protein (UPF0335 family)
MSEETIRAVVRIIEPEPLTPRPSNSDADINSLVMRLIAVEDKIDAENKLKALIYAEAKVSGVDIAALKSAVRIVRYFPQSKAQDLPALGDTVKAYLDLIKIMQRRAAASNAA